MIPVSRWMDDGTRREGTCEADDEAPSPPAEGEMARARERQTSERVAACRGEREAGRKHALHFFACAWWSARVHWQARLCSDAELRTDSSSLLCSTGGPCRESGGDAHGSPCENLLRAPNTRHVAPSRDLVRPGEATRGSRCAGRSALRAQASAHRLARIMSCQFDVRDNLDRQTLAAFESTSISKRAPTTVRREHVAPES